MTAVAVIGLGAMGSRLAGRLLAAGNEVIVWNRSPEKAAPLVDRGAIRVATPAEAASRAPVLITVVTDPTALRAVVLGDEGILAGTHRPLTVIEMSTIGPAAVRWLASTLPADVGLIDAPMLGSVTEAETGSLTLFVGGPARLVAQVEPLLSALGTPVHIGALGSGAAAKLVANASLFATVATLGEAVALAHALGLNQEAIFRVLASTPLAAQAERRRDSIKGGEYPPRFRLALARKDADLIGEAARTAKLDLRLTPAAQSWLVDAEAVGLADRDYTAILQRIIGGAGRSPARPEQRRGEGSAVPQPFGYDGLILDLDGVVWLAGEPIEGAVDAIARLRQSGKRVVFLTNDPRSSRAEHAARLTAIGIPASGADVITAAAATAHALQARAELTDQGVFVIGSPAFHHEISRAGLALLPASAAARAKAVAVGGHEGFDYDELRAATTAIANGASLFAAGRDGVFPTPDGPWPATGAIVAAIEAATGVRAVAIGKPEPLMFEIAREALSDCKRIAVVGDHLLADIAGAKRAGLDAILVLTGTTSPADLERSAVVPDLVFDGLAAFAAASA